MSCVRMRQRTHGSSWGSCNEHWTQLSGSGRRSPCQDLVHRSQHLLEDLHQAKGECVLVSQGLCHPSRVLHSYFYFLSSLSRDHLCVPVAPFPPGHQEWPPGCEEARKRLLQWKDLGVCRWVLTQESHPRLHYTCEISRWRWREWLGLVCYTQQTHRCLRDLGRNPLFGCLALAHTLYWIWKIVHLISLGRIQNLPPKYSGLKKIQDANVPILLGRQGAGMCLRASQLRVTTSTLDLCLEASVREAEAGRCPSRVVAAAVTGADTFPEATVAAVIVQHGQQQWHCASAHSLSLSSPSLTLSPDECPEGLTSVDHITGLSCFRLPVRFGHWVAPEGKKKTEVKVLLPAWLPATWGHVSCLPMAPAPVRWSLLQGRSAPWAPIQARAGDDCVVIACLWELHLALFLFLQPFPL